jgi:predicted SprT family Zn-dependent metalloprotease
MIDTFQCEQCNKEFEVDSKHGAFTSDGSFICNKCLEELFKLNEEQNEE